MNKLYLLLVLIGLVLKGNAQNRVECDILPSVNTNSGLEFHIKELTQDAYGSLRKPNLNVIKEFSNSDFAEKQFQKTYPDLFRMENENYIFRNFAGKEIVVKNNLEQSKNYSKYTFKGKYKKYVIILQEFYEGGNILVIDTENRITYSIPGKPIFINDGMLYSYVFEYGTAYLKIIDTEKTRDFNA